MEGFSEQGEITGHPELHGSVASYRKVTDPCSVSCGYSVSLWHFQGSPSGTWGGAITSKGLWYEELRSCREVVVMQDVCDTGWVEGYPPVSPLRFSRSLIRKTRRRMVCRLGWTLVPFFMFWPFFEQVITWLFGRGSWACRPLTTSLCTTTKGIDFLSVTHRDAIGSKYLCFFRSR